MKNTVSILCLSLLISACSKSPPKCNAPQTLNLVKQITHDQLVSKIGAEAASHFEYEVYGIRTIGENETTGAYQCQAQLKLSENQQGTTSELLINYDVGLTDDGKNIYATVLFHRVN